MSDDDAFRIMSRSNAGRWLCALVIAACLGLTSGCATMIDEHKAPPKGWPYLTIRDNIVSGWEVQRRCYKWMPLSSKLMGSFPMACAEVNFRLNTCDIWRAHDATPEILEHENLHCLGHSHPGDTWAEDALTAWRNYVASQKAGQ